MTITPELLRHSETGELVLKMTTLGAGLCWRLPPEATRDLTKDQLALYIDDLASQMRTELLRLKVDNQRRLRKKYAKKESPRQKHTEDLQERHLKAAKRASGAANEPTGV